MTSDPTIVFVPGAWHKPICYSKIIKLLSTQHNFRCSTVTLPSTLSDPSAGLKDDIDAARAVITQETSAGRNVVLVAHSYGGVVAGSALKGLTQKPLDSSTGYVVGYILIASGFSLTGFAFMDPFLGIPPPQWRINKDTGFADIVVPPKQFFYHDVAEDELDYWISQLTPQSLRSLFEDGEYADSGWDDGVPIWYIGTIEDQGMPVLAQRLSVGMARGMGASVQHRELRASHSPFLSMPDEVVELMVEAIGGFTGRVTKKKIESDRAGLKEICFPTPRLLQPFSWFKYGLPLLFGHSVGRGILLWRSVKTLFLRG